MSCEMSIINQSSFAILLRKTTLIERCDKSHQYFHGKDHKMLFYLLNMCNFATIHCAHCVNTKQ